MSVGFYRINKGGLHTLYSLLVRLTRNSHPFLFFSLEGRSFFSLVTRLVLEPGSYCTRMRQIFLECQETVLLLVNCRVMLTSSEQL